MTRVYSLYLITIGLGLFGHAWASGGVGVAAESTFGASAIAPGLKVAEIALPNTRKVEIYATGDGGFSYVQSGPIGTYPEPLPTDLAEAGDHIRVFQTLAPAQAIPGALRRAVQRVAEVKAMQPHAPETGLEDVEDETDSEGNHAGSGTQEDHEVQSDIADGQAGRVPLDDLASLSGSVVGGAIFDPPSRHHTYAGETGLGGCPEWWFNQAQINRQLFCPHDENGYCAKWVNWAFMYNYKGWSAHGAVCVDSGTAIWQTTNNNTVSTFWVPEGEWRYVSYYGYRTCGWFSCHDVRGFRKFELLNGSAVAHFGAQID